MYIYIAFANVSNRKDLINHGEARKTREPPCLEPSATRDDGYLEGLIIHADSVLTVAHSI